MPHPIQSRAFLSVGLLGACAALGPLSACVPAGHAPPGAARPSAAEDTAAPASDTGTAALLPAHTTRRTDSIAPGVVHRYEWREEGPWAIHVVEVDPAVCGIGFQTPAALDRVVGVETTSSLARRGGPDEGAPALVAINADFFRGDPFGVPEGPQVAGGTVVVAEGSYGPSVASRFDIPQPVFGVTRDGAPFVGEAVVEGSAWTAARDPYPLARVNAPPGPDSLALFNRFAGDETPTDTGVVEVVLRGAAQAPRAGDTARAVVARIDTLPQGVAVPADGVVLAGRGEAARWLRALAQDDTVAWTLAVAGPPEASWPPGAPGPVEALVGGFPLLLSDGRPVLNRVPAIREAFAARRHPRSAVAIRPDGVVLLVTVDGRQPGFSDGMTLPELTDLLQELGATEALNLDGGGSTALAIRGALVNRPSDPTERAVANAIIVPGPAAGECPVPGR